MSLKQNACIVFFLLVLTTGYAQKGTPIYLYPKDSIPNSKVTPAGFIETYANGWINTVSRPSITPYFPKKEIATKTAVIVMPGGGYTGLSMDFEGYAVAQKFYNAGITAFVLKYRLPDDRIMINRSIGPLQDAQRAIQIIRQRAKEWNLDSSKIGVIGFSAGGHLASTLGTHLDSIYIENKDSINLRPDFMVLMYPVITMGSNTHQGSKDALIGANASVEQVNLYSNEKQVTANTSPTFIAHSSTDALVPIVNSSMFYSALLKNKVIYEKHFYTTGDHGFGLTSPNPKENMFDLIQNWMRTNGWLPEKITAINTKFDNSTFINAFPNPFSDDFSVSFKLPFSEQNVALAIYDSKGGMLKSFSQKNIAANMAYTYTFKANKFSEGLYVAKLTTSLQTYSCKILKN